MLLYPECVSETKCGTYNDILKHLSNSSTMRPAVQLVITDHLLYFTIMLIRCDCDIGMNSRLSCPPHGTSLPSVNGSKRSKNRFLTQWCFSLYAHFNIKELYMSAPHLGLVSPSVHHHPLIWGWVVGAAASASPQSRLPAPPGVSQGLYIILYVATSL